jgi:hypothetical protein
VKTFAIWIWIAYVLAANAALVASMIDVESIVATGPMLTAPGIVLAYATRPLRSRGVLTVALSGPLVCAVIALSIAVFELGPGEAQGPVTLMLACYLLIFWPAAIYSLKRIVQWNAAIASPPSWKQFSLKTLLMAMTATCLLIVAVKQTANYLSPGEWMTFATFAFGVIMACAGIAWRHHVVRTATNERSKPDTEQPGSASLVDIEHAP